MQYFVIAPDGSQYGPATVDILKQWAQEGRLDPNTTLKDASTQATLKAGNVPGLFPGPAAPVYNTPPPTVGTPPASGYAPPHGYQHPPSGSPYLRPEAQWAQAPNPYPQQMYQQGDSNALWRSFVWSALAIIFFFVLRGIGLIVGISAIFYGYRAMASGHKYGMVAFIVSILAIAAVGFGWFLRLRNLHSY